MIPYYMTPEEGAAASVDQTDKALAWAIAKLGLYLQLKEEIRLQLERTDDDEEIGELEWRRKLLKDEESTVTRILSGLQSRLKVA